jgi:hypothetical protein
MMTAYEYLAKAQELVNERNDSDWFSHYYTMYRENFDVKVSAQRALWQLYGEWEMIGDENV